MQSACVFMMLLLLCHINSIVEAQNNRFSGVNCDLKYKCCKVNKYKKWIKIDCEENGQYLLTCSEILSRRPSITNFT